MVGGYGTLMSEGYPTAARATAQNVLWNIGRAVGGFGPVAVGALAAHYSFQTAIALLAGLYVLDMVATLFLIPGQGRRARMSAAIAHHPTTSLVTTMQQKNKTIGVMGRARSRGSRFRSRSAPGSRRPVSTC